MSRVFKTFFFASGIVALFFVGFFPFYAMLSKLVDDLQTAAYFSWMAPVMIWWHIKIWPVMIEAVSERLRK